MKAYLVGKGIAPERIEAKGYGPDQPISSNDTLKGRAKNRRIEFRLISQSGRQKRPSMTWRRNGRAMWQ